KKHISKTKELLGNKKLGMKIVIPVDVKVGASLESRKAIWRTIDEVKADEYILDIGPRTRRFYTQLVRHAGSVIWNGPLGLFENKHFRSGTRAIVRACANARGVGIIIGGGDTLSAVGRQRLSRKRNVFLSTGGGAMLAFLAGEELPGLEPLIEL
ncbi:phosphoglycerate kinase, partial [Patescibacteria group bacterium]|nr:phosphoglycerate kinase [Patescibacteria group bacterium]